MKLYHKNMRRDTNYKLKKLVTRWFLHEGILFKKGYDGDPLQCLGSKKAKEILKEAHFSECGEHQGRKTLYRCCLQMGCRKICEEMPWLLGSK